MSGAILSNSALSTAYSVGQDIINVHGETFQNYIYPILVIAGIGAGLYFWYRIWRMFLSLAVVMAGGKEFEAERRMRLRYMEKQARKKAKRKE